MFPAWKPGPTQKASGSASRVEEHLAFCIMTTQRSMQGNAQLMVKRQACLAFLISPSVFVVLRQTRQTRPCGTLRHSSREADSGGPEDHSVLTMFTQYRPGNNAVCKREKHGHTPPTFTFPLLGWEQKANLTRPHPGSYNGRQSWKNNEFALRRRPKTDSCFYDESVQILFLKL